MLETEFDDDGMDYWSNMSKEEQDRESARHTLVRMFPHLDEEELIQLEEGKLMRHTVNRVLERMLHDGCPTFNMDQTFDNDVFFQAKEEAYDLMLWIDSDDDVPMPDSLKWKPISTDEAINEEVEDEKPVKESTSPRKVRGVAPNSKYQKVLALVKEHLELEIARPDSVQAIVKAFDLNRATAESYYSKAKASLTLPVPVE